MDAKFLIRIFELQECSNIYFTISTDVISFFDSGVIKNIKVVMAESTTSSSWKESSDDTNLTP